ncbi:abscisic acid receptor PYR1 [Striga asiatica]|uniref:Abscisic acid receptor PYR1 n=1 Tax=Striga asiatica TaxID=4170 RepID=A0A5A7RB65_STRAF|nr:abscisic acid receptor PYR1 [Striga asiatica]
MGGERGINRRTKGLKGGNERGEARGNLSVAGEEGEGLIGGVVRGGSTEQDDGLIVTYMIAVMAILRHFLIFYLESHLCFSKLNYDFGWQGGFKIDPNTNAREVESRFGESGVVGFKELSEKRTNEHYIIKTKKNVAGVKIKNLAMKADISKIGANNAISRPAKGEFTDKGETEIVGHRVALGEGKNSFWDAVVQLDGPELGSTRRWNLVARGGTLGSLDSARLGRGRVVKKKQKKKMHVIFSFLSAKPPPQASSIPRAAASASASLKHRRLADENVRRSSPAVSFVRSLVRIFDQPQRCIVQGDLQIGTVQEVNVKSRLPTMTNKDRLELLDDEEEVKTEGLIIKLINLIN